MSEQSASDTSPESVTTEFPELADEPLTISLEEAEDVRLGLYDEAYADVDGMEMPDDPPPWREE